MMMVIFRSYFELTVTEFTTRYENLKEYFHHEKIRYKHGGHIRLSQQIAFTF